VANLVYILGLPFLLCLELTAILGYLGIHVLKREVIFVDIALAQIAAVGAIGAHLAFGAHGHSVLGYACAYGATLIVAAFYSAVRKKVVQIPLEAMIGISYAIAAAGALFLVGIAPGGHVHIQQMLAGSILWTTWTDIIWGAVLFITVGFGFYIFRRPLASISENYEKAAREGINTIGWDFLFYALLGLVITFVVRLAGVVVVFSILIIPATLSALFASDWKNRLIAAWITGIASATLGLLFAERFDFSVGPAIALFLGIALSFTGLLRFLKIGKTITATVSLILSAGALVWLISLPGASGQVPAPPALAAQPVQETDVSPHQPEPAPGIDFDNLAEINDPELLVKLYPQAADPEEQSRVISRLLELDPAASAQLVLLFLKSDPPLLFRQIVVEDFEKATGHSTGFDVNEPFNTAGNKKAAAIIAEKYKITNTDLRPSL